MQLDEQPDYIYISRIYIQSEVRMEDLSLHALEKTWRSGSIFNFSFHIFLFLKRSRGKKNQSYSVEDYTSVPIEGADDH